MKRRDFLKALGVSLAAAALVKLPDLAPQTQAVVPEIIPPPPPIDWAQWNTIELESGARGVFARINGHDVSAYPELMKRISGFVHIDHDACAVRFSSSGTYGASQSGITTQIDGLDSQRDIIVGLTLKCSGKEDPRQCIDHMFIADQPDAGIWMGDRQITVENQPERLSGVRIETIVPQPEPTQNWQLVEDSFDHLPTSELGAQLRITDRSSKT